MRKMFSLAIYFIVQILFIPLGIIGSLLIYYKQMFVSKKLGVSSTAIEIINGRWTMDQFGLRDDHVTVQLFKQLPNTTSLGQWMALFPLYLLSKLANQNLIYPTFKEAPNASLANLVTSRTVFFDRILKRSFQTSKQFVVLGAGFDTRCYGELIPEDCALYELDKNNTQDLKRVCLKKAGINTSNVNFVSVDFTTENWKEKLIAQGYDENKTTTFLWEGVSLYISEKDVSKTLLEIQSIAAKGSVLVADFYSTDFVKGKLLPGKEQLKITGENLGFGMDFQNNSSKKLESLATESNMRLGKVFFMGSNTKKGTWMAVSELLV